MPTLNGYRIGDLVNEGSRSAVYRAIRLEDHRSVIIKFHKSSRPGASILQRFRSEFEIGGMLDHPCVATYLALEKHGSGLALVTEDIGGITLAEHLNGQPIGVTAFFRLALPIIQGLKAVHEKGIMHKDLNPKNIVVHPKTGQVQIIDFGISSLLDQEKQDPVIPTQLGGTLRYISPEQTGRTNQAIDRRSDFYSLGATFYQMLGGSPPFGDIDDTLSLIHAHIARIPKPLHQLSDQIPKQLALVTAKMTAKDPATRYQSVQGLERDMIRCSEMWLKRRVIEAFTPGEADALEQFQLPVKLYGRENETDQLLRAFSRVSRGPTELLMVSGPPGIGKSCLVNELQRPVTASRGFFCSGKFEQYMHNAPYSAIGNALSELCRMTLSFPGERLEKWRARLQKALKSHAALVAEIVPDLKLVLDLENHPQPIHSQEARQRLLTAMSQFVQVFARKRKPLVLFLDDLQWADPASLDLLDALSESRYCLIIGAYRNTESDQNRDLLITLEKLEEARLSQVTLAPLGRASLENWLSDVLNALDTDLSLLADLLVEKTDGNPFFFNEFLKRLHDDGLLWFDHETHCWTWDLEAIHEQGITDNVVDLMQEKIHKQPSATTRLLRLGACLGTLFEVESLVKITGQTTDQTVAALWPAVREGLLLSREQKQGAATRLLMKFPHDRVRQAAYALTPEKERETMHLNIGRMLRETDLDHQFFPVLEHLNRGRNLMVDQGEKLQLARLNLDAGRKARKSQAMDSAVNHLQTSLELLPKSPWKSHAKLTRDIHQVLAACAFDMANWERCETLNQALLIHSKSQLEKARIHYARAFSFEVQSAYDRFFETARTCLQICDMAAPHEKEMAAEIEKENRILEQRLTSDLLVDHLPDEPLTDPLILEVMNILQISTVAAFKTGRQHWLEWAALKGLNLISEYGFCNQASSLLTWYSGFCWAEGKVEKAFYYADQVLALDTKYHQIREFGARSINDLYLQVEPYRKPLAQVAEHFHEASIESRKEGAFLSQTVTLANYVYFNFLLGASLERTHYLAATAWDVARRNRLTQLLTFVTIFMETTQSLSGRDQNDVGYQRPPRYWDDIKDKPLIAHFHKHFRLERAVWLLGLKKALDTADFEPDTVCKGLYHTQISLFLKILCQVADPTRRKAGRQALEQNLPHFKLLAHHGPSNFTVHYRLLLAEKARWDQEPPLRICQSYEQAVKAASEAGFLQYEALCHERLVDFWEEKGLTRYASNHLREAHYLLVRWGANSAARALLERHPHVKANGTHKLHTVENQPSLFTTSIKDTTSGSGTNSKTAGPSPLDLEAVMKAVRTISSEIHLDQLLGKMLQTMMECAGARRAVLIMDGDRGLRVKASLQVDNPTVRMPDRDLDDQPDLPRALIRFVFRTGKSVLLPDREQTRFFLEDDYLKEKREHAHFCMPLRRQDQITGVLYLENDLAAKTFTEQRVTVLNVLLAQVAISLENARLYSDIQHFNEQLEGMVEERTVQLVEAQEKLIEKAHQAGMADVAISVLHNLGNLLNSVLVSSQLIDKTIRSSRLGNMDKANNILRDLLEEWGKAPPKADKLVKYYQYLEELTIDEHQVVTEQIEVIIDKTNLIQNVIQSQQKHASGETMVECFSLVDAVREAHAVIQGLLSRNKVIFRVNIDPKLMVLAQKVKLSYVLVNLFRNSVEAMKSTPGEKRLITVTAVSAPPMMELRIADQGAGIRRENLLKIFNHGFSTRSPHRGFGLHNSANAVTEMGGSLWAESEGPDLGSVFIASLPAPETQTMPSAG